MTNGPTADKSISEVDFQQMWAQLSHNQQRYAVAMLECPTKKDAALAVGIEPDTVYRWNGNIDEIVAYMREQARDAALGVLESAVIKAATIKRAGLDSDDEKMRQDVASEVLDRILGKSTQRTEISGSDGGPVRMIEIMTVDSGEDGL